MDQEHQDRLRTILNTEVEWKIGGRSLDLWEKELIQEALAIESNKTSPYARLLESEKACRLFDGEIDFPMRIWRIQSPRGIEAVKEYMDSVLPEDTSFVRDEDTLVVFKKEQAETDYRIVDISSDLEAQVYQDVSIYVSYPVMHIEEIYPAYLAVGDLVHISKVLPNRTNVYEYEKMLLPSMLFYLREEGLGDLHKSLTNPGFLPLDQDLLDTAIEFLNTNLNVTETASRLYIHRNTLLYRLGKVKSQTGYDIRNFMEAVNFYLLYINKMLMK